MSPIKDLKAKWAKASEKVTELSRATAASWDKAKEGFANAYRDLAVAYDKAGRVQEVRPASS